MTERPADLKTEVREGKKIYHITRLRLAVCRQKAD